jgi:hypothetical protein
VKAGGSCPWIGREESVAMSKRVVAWFAVGIGVVAVAVAVATVVRRGLANDGYPDDQLRELTDPAAGMRESPAAAQ